MASADEEAMEGVGEALGRKRPRAPSVRYLWEVKAADAVGVFAHHEGGVRRNRVTAPGGQGGGRGRREGGPRPALECTLLLSFFSWRMGKRFLFSFVVSLLLVGWGFHYDRLGRSGARNTVDRRGREEGGAMSFSWGSIFCSGRKPQYILFVDADRT